MAQNYKEPEVLSGLFLWPYRDRDHMINARVCLVG